MIINIFTTPIKIVSISNFEEIEKTLGKCRFIGFKNNFYERLPEEEANKIKKIFLDEAELYLKELTNKKVDLEISKSWINDVKKYGFNTPHAHYGNTVVGVYYISANELSGDLLLHDPRGATNFITMSEINTEGNLVDGRSYYRITPKKANLVLFPTYLIHSVEPNMSDEKRICLAMNFNYKKL